MEESSAGRHQPQLRCRDESGNAANLRIGGIRLHCYCLFDEGLNLVNPDLHMGFLI